MQMGSKAGRLGSIPLLKVCLIVASCWLTTAIANAQTEEMPLWQYGISTFAGKTAKPEQSELAESLITPSEVSDIPLDNPETINPVAGEENQIMPEDAAVRPVAYQVGSGYLLPEILPKPPLPSLNLSPPAELPAPPMIEVPQPPDAGAGPSDPSGTASSIAEALEADRDPESPPLEEETLSWYEVPWRWVTRGWENHAELGLDGASGNSRVLALQMGMQTKRKTERYILGMDFNYRKATTAGITTEDNGRFNLDYDRLFLDSKWTAFGKYGTVWDQFKAFDLQINVNAGIGYHFIRTDDALLITRFGSGASQEIGAPDDAWKPEALFDIEGEYQINRYNKMKGKVNYFPAWEDFSDYRMVTDVAWEILLDDTDNLSLKLGLTNRHDSTPQGAKPNDVYYSLLLLVKF